MHFSPAPLRGRRGGNAVSFRQPPVTLLLYYSFDGCVEGVEMWNRTWETMTGRVSLLSLSLRSWGYKAHTAAVGLFRLTPRTITLVKERKKCVYLLVINALSTRLFHCCAMVGSHIMQPALIQAILNPFWIMFYVILGACKEVAKSEGLKALHGATVFVQTKFTLTQTKKNSLIL